MRTALLLAAAVLLASTGCRKQVPVNPPGLPSSVQRLTLALQAETGRYADDALVAEAFRVNPELARLFSGYRVSARSSGETVVTLICRVDGKRLVAEDASWTAAVDRTGNGTAPCEYTIRPTDRPRP